MLDRRRVTVGMLTVSFTVGGMLILGLGSGSARTRDRIGVGLAQHHVDVGAQATTPQSSLMAPPEIEGSESAELPNPRTTDLYGNEISNAVATYKFDAGGTLLYEEHSPQTEVPRLGIPTS